MRSPRRAVLCGAAALLTAAGSAGCFGGSVNLPTVRESGDASNDADLATDAGGHPLRLIGAISPPGDIDWWRISEAVPAGTIDVSCTADPGSQIEVLVYDVAYGYMGTVACDGLTDDIPVGMATAALFLQVLGSPGGYTVVVES